MKWKKLALFPFPRRVCAYGEGSRGRKMIKGFSDKCRLRLVGWLAFYSNVEGEKKRKSLNKAKQ